VELLRDGAPAPVGEIVATSLLDAEMPLIRYRTGDWGGPIERGGCECGRTLPVIGSIQGRCDDLLWSFDGRPVGRLDPVFKSELPVRETQVVQSESGTVRVLVVPADGFDQGAARAIVQALRDRLGDLEMMVETVERIPRGPNGKMKATISRYRPAQVPVEARCSSR
jgi:phenylacetate-CoA ligase